jgi:UDP-N-acetylmuramoyl-tripeptide--D-alanyl-D-alanine ligase
LKALEALAVYRRAQCQGKFIGITGSVGKTSTKETLSGALQCYGTAYATEGNLNNHIGLPLSLSRMPRSVEFGVFELGMNHADEIRPIAKILRPDIAVITNVSAVHIENFDSEEEIADAKAEILEGVSVQGIAVLNFDNKHFNYLKHKANLSELEVVTFGKSDLCDVQCIDSDISENGLDVSVRVKSDKVHYHLAHWNKAAIEHTMIALAVIKELGLPLDKAVKAFPEMSQSEGRGSMKRCGSWTLIDDSYNASPLSVASALFTLRQYQQAVAPKSRTVAILGDMLELGKDSPQLHQSLVAVCEENQIDKVITVGPESRVIQDSLPDSMRGGHYLASENVVTGIENQLEDGDIILIKGSRGIKMERIIVELQEKENDAL